MDRIVSFLMKNHRLREMALSRGDAISRCISLGKQFIEHYHKVYMRGPQDEDFLHHCHEMQNWYESARSIRLSQNKKLISSNNLRDWFFEVGAIPEDFISDPDEVDSYKRFVDRLLKDEEKKVVDTIFQEDSNE